jgi:hypothetical protein
MEFDDSQIDALDSFQVFIALAGEKFAPYATESVIEGNLEIIYQWGKEHLPGGLAAFKEVGAYELAFQSCSLTRDPNWISRADRNKQLQKEFDTMPAAESKRRYEIDPEFKAFIDAEQGAH